MTYPQHQPKGMEWASLGWIPKHLIVKRYPTQLYIDYSLFRAC